MDPSPRPIGIFGNLFAQRTETLILREKVLSLTGDSFEIKDTSGTTVLKVKGKVMSISGRKSVFDRNDVHLFDITKEHFHIHTTFAVESPQGDKLMEVKSKFKIFGSEANATITPPNGNVQQLRMEGNWADYSADIFDSANPNNRPIASISRKILSGRDLLFGQQTYALSVAPNVDMALMAALCICMDEKNNEK